MKTFFTLTLVLLSFHFTKAQSDAATGAIAAGNTAVDRTTALELLYEQAKFLENNGTATEIEANRLEIKQAWTEINPEIGDLFKPIDNKELLPDTEENLGANGPHGYSQTRERDGIPQQTREWDTDRLLLNDFIDGGVDIEVTGSGDIYVSAYKNAIENDGADFDIIYIYRSLDGGVSWEEWQAASVTAPMRKMQLISMDGSGDEYLIAYLVTTSENFQAWRWDTTNGNFQAQVIDGGVTDFSVDRNYPGATNNQRVFATYLKDDACSTEVYSARSTAGSYGFDWVDQVSVDSVCGAQVDFAYGRDGATYTVYTGAATGNLYVNVNSDYNDPTSWTARETLETGGVQEILNPTIAAARKVLASDEVIVWASARDAGTADSFDGIGFLRENGGAFGVFSNFNSGGANWNVAHTDAWIRKVNDTEIIRTAYVRDNIDNSSNDLNRSLTYNGTGFDTFEAVADTDVDVWDGFPSATAETDDEMPCMAFAGTSGGGGFGFGLYFDAKTEIILNTQDNFIEGLTYYPNPTRDVLNVNASTDIDQVEIYSITGAKVFESLNQATSNAIQINTSDLSSGVYMLRVIAGAQTATFKVIKQ